jgi:hypothetical protein
MPSVVEDQQGNLGVTWMESSSSEYLSMWVGNLYTNGTLSPSPPLRVAAFSSSVFG